MTTDYLLMQYTITVGLLAMLNREKFYGVDVLSLINS